MRDKNKTKQQLLGELTDLRQKMVTLTDLKARCRQMEAALRESEERCRSLAESVESEHEITERLRAENLLRVQRDLAISLSSTSDLNEALNRLLEATFQTEGVDCGGVYLVDERTGEVNLVVHHGLPPQFVASASHYDADSLQAGLLIAGSPLYLHYAQYSPRLPDDPRRHESLRALAILPVKYEGQVVAALNLASHTHDEIPAGARNMIENIAAQIGGVVARVRAEEALRQAHDELELRVQERTAELSAANAALRAHVSERKRAEEALRESETRFRALAESSASAIFMYRFDARLLYANPSMEVITGYTRDELIRRSIWDLIHPDFQDLIRQRMLARQGGDAIPSRIEFKIVAKSGEERWVDYAGAFVELAGQPTMIGTAFDITERKWAEEALRNSREQLALVMDGVPALIAYVDSDERYLYVNKAYAEWYGRSREDYIGMRIRDLLDEQVYQRASPNYKAALSGQRVSFENRAYNKDWQERVVSVNFVPHFDEKGSAKAFFALIQDITDSKRAEEALRQSNAELQVRNEELDAFAHTVAHDLRNPLSLIVGLAKTLELDHTSLPGEEVSQYLHRLGQYALKINNIIDELLLLAGVRQTQVKLTPLDMTGIVTEALQRLTGLTESHQAEIVLPQVWPEALGYAPWVEEVWVNYLSNAIRYGGRPPHVELEAETRADGTVRFSVRDNGPGITLEDQARLFTPFTRLDQVRAKGYGLGLSIVRRIVEKLGGQVGVESQVGRGSTFFFILPESRVSENPQA